MSTTTTGLIRTDPCPPLSELPSPKLTTREEFNLAVFSTREKRHSINIHNVHMLAHQSTLHPVLVSALRVTKCCSKVTHSRFFQSGFVANS